MSPASVSSSSAPTPAPATATQSGRSASLMRMLPGIALSFVAVGLALLINHFVPALSVMLVAIILGVFLRNIAQLPAVLDPGLVFTSKRLLRAGVVLLGLQLVVADIVALGAGMIGVVVAVIVLGIVSTLLVGRALHLSITQTLLIACGFSICGAAAVAAVDGVIEAQDREEVVTAIAQVVIFGTLLIPLIPILGTLFGLDPLTTGLWGGAATHEVAQVVAIGGALGGGEALSGAVVVKLARVLMLAPVMATISIWRRQKMASGAQIPGMGSEGGKLPPLMPLFVFGFIVMVFVRWTGIVPASWLAVLKIIQTALLASAMFALGTSVKLRDFASVGPKPFILATSTTVIVALTGFIGVMLAH